MTRMGRREFFRRIVVLASLIAGLSMVGRSAYGLALALGALSVAVYVYLPAVQAPKNALRYDAGATQVGPDWIGFVLSSLFFVFPIWAAMSEPHWGTIHPSSVVLWPMGLVSSSLWVIGALHASYWILVKTKEYVISSAFSQRNVAFDTIKSVRRYKRGLPKWLYVFVPFMIAKGQYGGAGSLLLARDRTGMELELKDGRRISISDSGYDDEIVQILQPLERHNVKLAAAYRKLLTRHAEA
ncbi:hypothetical protein [Falsiphaeobacter marinintestinus]|uniref:hypothetical protein n=1 Tax=Falsiphaeobacter marinintestinus TaxID=1492905 RepID=UPI0011B37BE5|nr:hypothetical protein [Phaeobacter marinintestinus]